MKDIVGMIAVALMLFAIIAVNVASQWYKAENQRQVYEREGIHISTWEIMWGAKPAERVIR